MIKLIFNFCHDSARSDRISCCFFLATKKRRIEPSIARASCRYKAAAVNEFERHALDRFLSLIENGKQEHRLEIHITSKGVIGGRFSEYMLYLDELTVTT